MKPVLTVIPHPESKSREIDMSIIQIQFASLKALNLLRIINKKY